MHRSEILWPQRSLETTFPIKVLHEQAMRSALSQATGESSKRQAEVLVERSLVPHLAANEEISIQLIGLPYLRHMEEVKRFLGTETVSVLCSHSAVPSALFVDPATAWIHKRYGGLIEAEMTPEGKPRIKDRSITGAIKRFKDVPTFEMTGIHIDTFDLNNSCNELKRNNKEQGGTDESFLQDGGLSVYLRRLDRGFSAFKEAALRTGSKKVETYSVIQDTYTGGLIVGLKQAYEVLGDKMFKTGMPLRDLLKKLHKEKIILMTEELDQQFAPDIYPMLQYLTQPQNIWDPNSLATNLMTVGKVAMNLTKKYEVPGDDEKNFEFIPRHLLTKDPDINRTLAYHIIRNCAFRVLGKIKPGNFNPPESRIYRLGSIGPYLNPSNIQVTFEDNIQPADMEALQRLTENPQPRVIMANALLNENIGFERKAWEQAEEIALTNADLIMRAIPHKDTYVIPSIFGQRKNLKKILIP